MNERKTRRIDRHRMESNLPPDKRLADFDFSAVPTVTKVHVTTLAEGDSWIEQGANILLFGPPGVGKPHFIAAIGHGLIERLHTMPKECMVSYTVYSNGLPSLVWLLIALPLICGEWH